jgi:hypothetical protein
MSPYRIVPGHLSLADLRDLWASPRTIDVDACARPRVEAAAYANLMDPALSSATVDGGTVTICARNMFAFRAINEPEVKGAIRDAAASVLNEPADVRVVKDDGGSPGGSARLDDALKKFPGIVTIEE